MPKSNKVITTVVGGEVSPFMYARLDLPLYAKALTKCENFLLQATGGARFRTGTSFVHFTRRNQAAVLIPFQFNAAQAFLIEATPGFFRFYNVNGVVTGNDISVTAMTNANPGVFTTAVAHNLTVGQEVILNNMNGTTIASGTTFTIAAASFGASTFSLLTFPGGTAFNTTSIGTFIPNGQVQAVWNLSAITAASPGVFTIPNNPFSVGDEIFISGVQGMTQVNGQFYLVNGTSGTGVTAAVTLTDLFGNSISTLNFAAYTSGGTAARVLEIATPYQAADLPYLQNAQISNLSYIVNQNYAPMKLTRVSNASWTLATFSRTGTDPFTGAGNWPAAVCFDGNGRLLYGGTVLNPQTVWGSSLPSGGGGPVYDDFTFGTSATNAVQFTLGSTASGRADAVQWIGATDNFSVVGTFGTVRTLYGTNPGQPISATSITALPIGNYGCAYTLPIALGYSLFYVQRANLILRSIEYDIYIQNYNTTNRNLVADHITQNGLKQIALQQGNPDVIYGTLGDGRYASLTVQAQENISGWARHYLGGQYIASDGATIARGNITWLQTIPRVSLADQLWFVTNRNINGNNVYCVEQQTDFQIYPLRHDFYTTASTTAQLKANKAVDDQAFENAIFEVQKRACHLDMSLMYDGTAPGITANATVTPGTGATVEGTLNVPFTSNNAVFNSSMGGQQIWGAYDRFGNGGGRAIITGVVSTTQVLCTILSAFPSLTAITPSNWLLTVNTVTGLSYLNGTTVSVLCDGGPDVSQTVLGGQITVTAQSSVIIVGLPYVGTIESMNIDSGGITGSAENKARNISHVSFNFYCSLGAQFGTSYYALDQIYFKKYGQDVFDRPTVPYSGIKNIRYSDSTSKPNTAKDASKRITVIQNQPLPCNILSIDTFVVTADEQN